MNINLNLYKYFYVVAKNMSFSKASEELLISQPSLSYSVKALETQLGYQLFNRENKGLSLTSDGKKLFDMLLPVMQTLSNVDNNETLSGNVVVSIPPLFNSEIMPKYLNIINSLYKEIKIVVKVREYEEMLEEFLNNKIDIMITDKIYSTDNIESKYSSQLHMETCLFTGANNSKYNKESYTLEDINKEEVALVETNKYSSDFILMYPNIKNREYFSTPQIIELSKSKDLVGLIPKIVGEKYEYLNEIKVLNTAFELPKIDMTITYNKNRLNSAINAVIDVFLNYNINDK